MIKVKKGLDIPLEGSPRPTVDTGPSRGQVALLGSDYVGMKPSLLVKVGDRVKVGQAVFACKRNEGLIFTSPACGKVVAINRGEKRAFQSLVIQPEAKEEHQEFSHFHRKTLETSWLRSLLVESGLWTAIRERPYDKIATVSGDLPKDIFVSIADSNPAAPSPLAIINLEQDNFAKGLSALEHLCQSTVFVCSHADANIQLPDLPKVKQESFSGPHPSGNVGTHMHFLSPPRMGAKKWYVGYQDVIAIGYLLNHGKLSCQRYIGLSGPEAKNPRIIKTRIGIDLNALVADESIGSQDVRVISGSVLHGHTVQEPVNFLGRYHNQVTLLKDDHARELLGWHMPGFKRFSAKKVFFSSLIPFPNFDFSTSTHGSPRALVPFGHYEKVCAFDTLPTQLLRALLSKDTDTAQELGVLEMGEEDMSLFTFVSTGKEDFASVLRENLDLIEKEG